MYENEDEHEHENEHEHEHEVMIQQDNDFVKKSSSHSMKSE